MNYAFIQHNLWIVGVLLIWELVWKGIALWKAARNNQLGWFLVLFIINTLGILPMIYIIFFDKEEKA